MDFQEDASMMLIGNADKTFSRVDTIFPSRGVCLGCLEALFNPLAVQ